VLKPFLRGHEDKIFILDFFGAANVRNRGIRGLPSQHILTAFGSVHDNAFLGYFIDEAAHAEHTQNAHKVGSALLYIHAPEGLPHHLLL
jgi:hypothetical protein